MINSSYKDCLSVCMYILSVDLGMDEEEDEAVPLPNVNAAILKKVITQLLQFHFQMLMLPYLKR